MSSANQPGIQSVHVNRPLTNISVAMWQDPSVFAFNRVFPNIPVSNKSDSYFKFRLADSLRDDMRPRAPGAESAGSGYNYDQDNYSINVYALHHDIADQIRANADAPLQLDADTTRWLTQQAMIRQERLFATRYLTTGVWGLDIAGAASSPTGNQVLKWSDDASDPVADVKKYMTQVQLLSGVRPNVLVLSQDVRDALDTNPAIIDRIKYSGGISNNTPVMVNDSALAQVFGVEEVIVSGAIAATSAEDAATLVNQFISSGTALLAYRTRTPGTQVPTAGYRFSWRGYTGNNEGMLIKKFRMEHLEADRVEATLATDMKVSYAAAGALFTALV